MPKLTFALDFSSAELANAALPVEVRRIGPPFVQRTISTEKLEVPAGQYFVSARMPAGQELGTLVEVSSKGATARLVVPDELRSPHEWAELAHFTHGQRKSETPPSDSGDAPADAGQWLPRLRIFSGNAFARKCRELGGEELLQRDPNTQNPLIRYDVRLGGCSIVQLCQDGRAPQNVVVATSPAKTARALKPMSVIVTAFEDHSSRIEAHLVRPEVDLLARYARRGDFENATLIAGKTTETALRLVYEKQDDPVAAAAGTCALMRYGERGRLQIAWTENLARRFTWLPDGRRALRGASRTLRQARRGCTELHRLRFARAAGVRHRLVLRRRAPSLLHAPEAEGVERGVIRRALKQIERFTKDVDPVQPITTFQGADPNRPSQKIPTGGRKHRLAIAVR